VEKAQNTNIEKRNKVLRRIFYNLAIRAIRLIEKYKKKYQELITRDKKPKQAIIAIARKLAEISTDIMYKKRIV